MSSGNCPICGAELVANILGKSRGYSCPRCKYWGGLRVSNDCFSTKICLIHSPSNEAHVLMTRYPPLGLLYLAAILQQNGYRNISLIDAGAKKMSIEEIMKIANKDDFAIFGISCVSITYKNAKKIAQEIKKEFPNSKIIMGGPHPSVMPEATLAENPEVDAIVVGEGEYTFLELVNKVRSEESFAGIRGIVHRQDGKILTTPQRPLIENLDELPFPAWNLIKELHYSGGLRGSGSGCILSSRGCPFTCSFCVRAFQRKWRGRSPQNIIDEIEHLVLTKKIKDVVFQDDCFSIDKSRVIEICDAIKKRGINIRWSCISRVDSVSEEMLKKMKEAGCYLIQYGVESGDERVLRDIRKKITPDKVRRAFEITKKSGITVEGNFMIGFPTDTEESINRTIEFAVELDPDVANFNITVPLYGTDIYFQGIKEGWLEEKSLEHVAFSMYQLSVYFALSTNRFDIEEMRHFLKYALVRFYARRKRFIRAIFDDNGRNILLKVAIPEKVYEFSKNKNYMGLYFYQLLNKFFIFVDYGVNFFNKIKA